MISQMIINIPPQVCSPLPAVAATVSNLATDTNAALLPQNWYLYAPPCPAWAQPAIATPSFHQQRRFVCPAGQHQHCVIVKNCVRSSSTAASGRRRAVLSCSSRSVFSC